MTYDLTTEPWIPVRWTAGEDGPPTVGLREALAEAHRIAEVAAPSPLETVAIYRLLQALFVRLHVHPENADDDEDWTDTAWQKVWDDRQFNDERIADYFDRWQGERKRFDLLHPERPFYGHPDPATPNTGPLSWLTPTRAKGNNETLFDHTVDTANAPLSRAAAARALLAAHVYSLGGLAGPGRPSYQEGPLVSGLVFWIRGENLFEALLLNTPSDEAARLPSPEGDKPAWERPLPGDDDRPELGYLDYLTWQSRHVRLIAEERDGEAVVTDVHLRSGPKWVSAARDPLMAYRVSKKEEVYPFKLQPNVALWRRAPVWLGLKLEGPTAGYPPRTFAALAARQEFGGDIEDRAETVDVFGLANNKAKMELIRHERTPLFPAVLRLLPLQETVDEAVQRADRQMRSLRAALRRFTETLAPGKPEDVRTRADGLQAEERFWTWLDTGFLYGGEHEPGFEDWLADLAALPSTDEVQAEKLSDDTRDALRLHLARWTRTLHRAAMRAYDEATGDFVTSPRRLKAIARGRNALRPAARYADLLREPESADV